jgi:hypothetical protein
MRLKPDGLPKQDLHWQVPLPAIDLPTSLLQARRLTPGELAS